MLACDLPRLWELNFGIISAMQMLEVVHIQRVNQGGVAFFRGQKVHVVINTAATYTARLSDGERRHDFVGRKFDHGYPWKNRFCEHLRRKIGSHPDPELSACEGREGLKQRVGIDTVAALEQER